jgi:hypothetical protein
MFLSGSTKALRIVTNAKLSPQEIFPEVGEHEANKIKENVQVFYDADGFDQSFYMLNSGLRPHLLNGDATIADVRTGLGWWSKDPIFIKPGSDLKLFAGVVIEPYTTLREELDKTGWDGAISEYDRIIIAPIKKILYEWRLFVVNGMVVASSQYKRHGKIEHDVRVPGYVIREAESFLIPLYKPDPVAFVMDVCLTDDGDIKIVEYNCINCSGFYQADVAELAYALKTAF